MWCDYLDMANTHVADTAELIIDDTPGGITPAPSAGDLNSR